MARRLADRGLVILDRDGVINRDSRQFVKSADEWIPLRGSIRAIADLGNAGYTVAIASNQSGLARGLLDRNALRAMHRKLRALVSAQGGHIDRIVVCPHGPKDGCECRKPKPGLLLRLGRYYGTDLNAVPVIGDSLRDLEAADSVGARPILVRTGNGRKTEAALGDGLAKTEVYDDLAAAAAALVNR
ncbi:MAG: D-glycero-beta-D-manno-heptose 1,7-bisphosphate 7-phosphatase [Woeseiaceae bacterium]|nr:D-glycero-beta-D-manno-heptose 1,7-bisphosphate 7-phosphatase [Woeseiaceae bacterium]